MLGGGEVKAKVADAVRQAGTVVVAISAAALLFAMAAAIMAAIAFGRTSGSRAAARE